MEQVTAWLDDHADQFVDELKQFLRIPSISADSQYSAHMTQAAEFVRDRLVEAGAETQIIETDGHAIVYGSRHESDDAPTVVVYGHYDVQPPDPLDEWVTPPFEPDIRDGCIWARGATDDKGQLYTHIKSVQAWTQTVGRLPVNVKFIIEGEEEVGSENLDRYLEQNRDDLSCDVAVISDTSQYSPELPAITYGLRGGMWCEVELTGPNQDLHSGIFGGSVANPVNALCGLIGKLIDDNGRIQVPGFYDNIPPLSDTERERMGSLPFEQEAFLGNIGVSAPHGEDGFSTLERRWARPTCDVNGVIGGYTGEGPKSIVPARASAKLSFRLVPNQDPTRLSESLEQFLRDNCPPGLKMTITPCHGAPAVLFDVDSPWMGSAQAAIESAFGNAPVFVREGGSIPVVTSFREILGVDTLLLGWGQNTDNLHSPNEHFRLQDFHRGTRASAILWQELANAKSG